MNITKENHKLFDYFAIVGLDSDRKLDDNVFQKEEAMSQPPLERGFKAQLLGHYPEHSVSARPFDQDAVLMLCLPRGLRFRTQKHSLAAHFHSFLVTREDGTRCYGFAYLFFEEVNCPQICTALHSLQSVYLTSSSSSQQSGHLRASSASPAPRGSHSLPREFRMGSPGSAAAADFYDVTKDHLYVTKCIVLVGPRAHVRSAKCFLMQMYRYFLECEGSGLSLESHVYNLLYEVTSPPPGRCISFSCFGYPQICYYPSANEFPLFEFSLLEVFTLIPVERIVQLLTCVLLENQIILVSMEYEKLMLVAESICCLLFPFVWPHVYVPILPASLHQFMDAPVPFIMGLQSPPNDNHNISIPNEANLCLVHIDDGLVDVPEDLPQFPFHSEFTNELTELLVKWGVQNSCVGRKENKLPTQRKVSRRHKGSWGRDSNSGEVGGVGVGGSFYHGSPRLGSRLDFWLDPMEPSSPQLREITSIARRAGVYHSVDMIDSKIKSPLMGHSTSQVKGSEDMLDMCFNNSIREIFLCQFVQTFCTYDHFVLHPNYQEMSIDQWICCRESVHSFDKATFLSDHPRAHLPFLSRFIESQMFTSFIDNKILSNWGQSDDNIRLFDLRIRALRDQYDDSVVRTPGYQRCTILDESNRALEQRLTSEELRFSPPSPLDPQNAESCTHLNPSHFPLLDKVVLNKESVKGKKQSSVAWRRRERQVQHLQSAPLPHLQWTVSLDSPGSSEGGPVTPLTPRPKLADMSPAQLAHNNWKFVEQLLKECKTRTKRMLVEKMGSEAVELGLGGLGGLEENTLIASLCDLLERVWAHGLQTKQGKSALWSHLLSFQELDDDSSTLPLVKNNFLSPVSPLSAKSPASLELADVLAVIRMGNFSSIGSLAAQIVNNFDLSVMALETESAPPSPTHSLNTETGLRKRATSNDRRSTSRSGRLSEPGNHCLPKLPVSAPSDMRSVMAVTEVKSDIGYARAWVRLALEKKLLSRHFSVLLANGELLRTLYKRYAFLRCDEEKEQFLSHLLSLNAVDYYCFTNTYTLTVIPYRVLIFPSRKMGAASTSANVWVSIGGTLAQTGHVPVPRPQLEALVQHKNLGLLTTLRIGHDNTGLSSKWLVEHVLVRNEVTGHTWKFPCGRWLGRGIDDGSLERILVGELVPWNVAPHDLIESCRTPPRCRSPNPGNQRRSEGRLSAGEIQQLVGDAVNNLVKFFCKPERERGNLTVLLCGDLGLVSCLELVFLFSFKSTRLFVKNLYVWDYFERVQQHFECVLRNEAERQNMMGLSRSGADLGLNSMAVFTSLISRINASSSSLGKDDKFQLFVCLAAREHLLHRLPLLFQRCPVTSQMYEENSFLRDPQLVRDTINVLSSLAEFKMELEAAITYGID